MAWKQFCALLVAATSGMAAAKDRVVVVPAHPDGIIPLAKDDCTHERDA